MLKFQTVFKKLAKTRVYLLDSLCILTLWV